MVLPISISSFVAIDSPAWINAFLVVLGTALFPYIRPSPGSCASLMLRIGLDVLVELLLTLTSFCCLILLSNSSANASVFSTSPIVASAAP